MTASKLDPLQDSKLASGVLACFQDIVKRELLFHSIFAAIGCLFIVGFLFFFSFLADSFLMGIFIAVVFFASVLYFVLRLYFQDKKPQEFLQLRNEYLAECNEQDPDILAEKAHNFAMKLQPKVFAYNPLPKQLEFLTPHLQKLWGSLHTSDVHLFKKLFLETCVELKLERVKEAPTDPETHSELASAYMALAEHCKTAKNDAQFRAFANLALVELQIVAEYAPKDVWVHAKLAESYHALGMVDKAIEEFETLLHMNPEDLETLHRVGLLYFKLGLHGKGLKAYEKLKKQAPVKAQQLISAYGSSDLRHLCPSTPQ